MKRINHTIKRKKIPEVKLVSLTSKTWYDSNGTPISWTGATDFLATGFTPDTGFLVFNVTGGTVTSGYYKWNTPTTGDTWNLIIGTGTTEQEIETHVNSQVYDDFQLPLFLEATADEMGEMITFDGDIGQNTISANFTYEVDGPVLRVWNTTNYGKLKAMAEATYTIHWGDGTKSGVTTNGSVIKQYTTNGEKIDVKYTPSQQSGFSPIPIEPSYTGNSIGFSADRFSRSPWRRRYQQEKLPHQRRFPGTDT